MSDPRPLGSCADRLTPLAAAAQFSDPGPAQTLLDHGAEVDPLALFYAMQQQNENGMATTRLLVEHGADLNHVARNWGTPLCYAVQQGDRQTLEYLLEKGANPMVGSENRGMLPVELARFCGKSELAEILEKAMLRRSKRVAERASNVEV
jgi:ankyrin repeat protein